MRIKPFLEPIFDMSSIRKTKTKIQIRKKPNPNLRKNQNQIQIWENQHIQSNESPTGVRSEENKNLTLVT